LLANIAAFATFDKPQLLDGKSVAPFGFPSHESPRLFILYQLAHLSPS
jgi:hypothetical protein